MGLHISKEHTPGVVEDDFDSYVSGHFQTLRSGSRKHGATQKQFQDFIRAADSGLRVEMHGQSYVAMSRNIYEDLIGRANPITTVTEVADLTAEDIELMRKGLAS